MAGKRVSLASLAGSKVETVPGASRPDLVHVHPDTVAPTPLNPRRDFNDDALRELGNSMRGGQLQPCVAVSRATYSKVFPEHEEHLGPDVRYVMAAGERRWKAARLVGLDTLDVLVRHDLTESRVSFLAAVLAENVDRANFNPVEEAHGLRAMLELNDGNQTAAAKAMGKSKQWFSQRIGLLRLSEDMMELVLTGKLTAFRDMRRYSAMPPQEQYAAWKADQEAAAAPKPPAPKPAPEPAPEQREVYTAVYAEPDPPRQAPALEETPSARTSGPADRQGTAGTTPRKPVPETPPTTPAHKAAESSPGQNVVYTAVYTTSEATPPTDRQPAEPTPEPHRQEADPEAPAGGPRRFPYEDAGEAAFHLTGKMRQATLAETVRLLVRHMGKHQAGTLQQILAEELEETGRPTA